MMNKLLMFSTFTLIFCICKAQNKNSESEAAIKKIVHKVSESLENQNLQERIAIFSKDAVVINAFGNISQGEESVKRFWTQVFNSGMFENSTQEDTLLKITFITDDIAVADRFYILKGQITPKKKKEVPPRTIHTSMVLKKDKNKWLIHYYSVADLRELGGSFTIFLVDETIKIKFTGTEKTLNTLPDLDNFITSIDSQIDSRKIYVEKSTGQPFDRLKSVSEILKKHGYNSFQFIMTD